MARTLALLPVISAALVLMVAGCSQSASGLGQTPGTEPQVLATAPGSTPEQLPEARQESPWQQTALWVERDGVASPFENGTALVLGGLELEVFLAPYPPLREGSFDFYVTDRVTRLPLEDSAPEMDFDMYMPHGNFKISAVNTGGGHFLIPYKLAMPGEWRAHVSFVNGGEPAAVDFLFRVE